MVKELCGDEALQDLEKVVSSIRTLSIDLTYCFQKTARIHAEYDCNKQMKNTGSR